jgi:hypothetical protein
VTAAGTVPRTGEDSLITQSSSRRSFAEAAIRAEIRALQRQLRELYEMGGPVTPEEAGLQYEVTTGANATGGQTAAAAPRAMRDVDGYDLRPDPLTARTPAEFMDAMRQFRAWAGDPSFRAMSDRSDPHLSSATLCTALSRDALPTLAVVQAVITACGGSEDDQRQFTTGWRQLRLRQDGDNPHEPQQTGDHAA